MRCCRSSHPLAAAALAAMVSNAPLRNGARHTGLVSAFSSLPDSHRVFVGNLSPDTCKEEVLRSSFGQFGSVVDVTLHGLWKRSVDDDNNASNRKKRSKVKPYAFITFDDAISATAAVQEWGEDAPASQSSINTPPIAGCVVKPANARKPRPKSNNRKARAQERQKLVERLSQEANVVLQCPKSHMERLSDYLRSFDGVEVLSDLDPGKRAVTLLFVKADDAPQFADRLLNVPYAAIAVNKMYILDGDVIKGNIEKDVAKLALDKLANLRKRTAQSEKDIVVRVQAFPPKKRSELIASMDSNWNENELNGVDISPTGFTHTLSVVQIETPKEFAIGDVSETNEERVHLLGLTPALPTDAITTHDRSRFHEESNEEGGKDQSVSRAYYKLQEALTRYSAGNSFLQDQLTGSIALDCGAAPGGWTKYLIDKVNCSAVFSVDPGSLDPTVEGFEGVQHMRQTIEEAIPTLAAKETKIDFWVSDMCLHAMSDQVDWLLKARTAGILSQGAAFVLTLKCNIGHSAASYDKQVGKEVARLEGIAKDIQTLHLFSNRNGERTLIGSLK